MPRGFALKNTKNVPVAFAVTLNPGYSKSLKPETVRARSDFSSKNVRKTHGIVKSNPETLRPRAKAYTRKSISKSKAIYSKIGLKTEILHPKMVSKSPTLHMHPGGGTSVKT